MELALFPLSVFLLPGGRTRLRIFEPRYLRLVSEAMSSQQGFGLCLPTDEDGIYELGTQVEIYDFDQGDDGYLTIDIVGKDRFIIENVSQDADGLMHGEVALVDSWDIREVPDQYHFIADSLEKALDAHPLYDNSKSDRQLQDLSWVCQRWLEILPIAKDKKYYLAQQNDLNAVVDFVCQVIKQ
ncbi:LON peptidase substrate-binding domain-containing protein [Motilimonas pumila]|uniref:Peptidase S16 n=1 Tax=Motilimonas pumila TaxID=2303987 RepID=A0A418YFP3_9GAMM|nr:LON peptidase substrate-binding domain-containing protein [Motilimonas pumila]RJG48129.1 peptidase S16 [Motilimonas pumila]